MIRILVLLLLTVSTTMAQATFHGDTARTGVYPTPGPQQLNGTKWTFKTDGPIIGSPSIANGVIYMASTDGNVYALDQETGKRSGSSKHSPRDRLLHHQRSPMVWSISALSMEFFTQSMLKRAR